MGVHGYMGTWVQMGHGATPVSGHWADTDSCLVDVRCHWSNSLDLDPLCSSSFFMIGRLVALRPIRPHLRIKSDEMPLWSMYCTQSYTDHYFPAPECCSGPKTAFARDEELPTEIV